MKSLTDSEKIRLAKLRKYSLGVQPLEDNLKRIKQSKCQELKKFAIHLANCLERSEKELYELKTTIKNSKHKEFKPEYKFREQIFELAAEHKKEHEQLKKSRNELLKYTISIVIHLFNPITKEYKLLESWAKELENKKSNHQGIIKHFQNHLDRNDKKNVDERIAAKKPRIKR